MKVKAQNLLCCAALTFVNQRIDTRSGGNDGLGSLRSRYRRKLPPRLCLNGDYGCDDRGGSGSGDDADDFRERSTSRRSLLRASSRSLLASASLMMAATNARSARAACLSGDVRAECIGVYKLPVDAAESPYVESPEKLKVYAPDLKWVPPPEYPPNYPEALKQLGEQSLRLNDARGLVAKGDIEQAGLGLLDIVPKVSASGIVIMKTFGNASNNERNAAMKKKTKNISYGNDSNDGNPSSTAKAANLEMKAYRIEVALNELLGCLGEADILVGQGLRGELGVSAPAQIEILSQLSDCRREFDNLLGTVPEKVSGL